MCVCVCVEGILKDIKLVNDKRTKETETQRDRGQKYAHLVARATEGKQLRSRISNKTSSNVNGAINFDVIVTTDVNSVIRLFVTEKNTAICFQANAKEL